MISSAEETAQRRRSAEPPQPSTPEVTYRDGLDEDEFLNKVCKFELISRGKSSSVKSPTSKGSGKFNISAPDNRSGRRSGENFQNYPGEKLFTKDTATTRVSASILQAPVIAPKPDINSQVLNTGNLGSFGSVSSRRKSSESRNSRSSTKSTDSSSPAVVSGNTSPGTGNVFFSGSVSPVKKTELPAAHYFDSYGVQRSPEQVTQSGYNAVQKPGALTLERPVITSPKPQISAPVVTVDLVKSDSKEDSHKQENSVDVERVKNGIATKDLLTVDKSNGDVAVSRNTFEGIDFDFNELTESQKDLTLKHREIVAERKQEQEMERLERLRLEEILNMCADYERQIEDEKKQITQKHHENFVTATEWSTPPIPPLPLQYQHLQNTAHHGNQIPGSPRSSQVQVQGHIQVPGQFQNQGQGQQFPQQRTAVPPGGLEFETHSMDRKEFGLRSEYRSSMTNKIMTNGSLTMLSSPTNTHKDFFHGFQIRKCGSNSSNSEEESLCGSSEDTGTIKRRPNSNQGLLSMDRPMSPRTTPHSLATSQISKYSSQSVATAQSDQSVPNQSSSPFHKNETTSVTWSQTMPHSEQKHAQGDFQPSFKIEPLRLTNVSVEFVERKQFENMEPGSHSSTYSEPECDLQISEQQSCELQVHEPVLNTETHVTAMGMYHTGTSPVQGDKVYDSDFGSRNSAPEALSSVGTNAGIRPVEKRRNTDHHDYVNIPVNGAQFSDSNSGGSASSSTTSTVCAPSYHGFINNILSTGSPRSSGSMSGSKSSSIENVTPVNSDTEFTTQVARRQGSRSSSTATTDSSEYSIGTVDVSTFALPSCKLFCNSAFTSTMIFFFINIWCSISFRILVKFAKL